MACIGPALHKAVIENDHMMVNYYLRHTTAKSLKKIYIALKYSNFDLYLDYIRAVARERIRVKAWRALVLKLDLPMDMCLCIHKFI